jgi:hypothetical protein
VQAEISTISTLPSATTTFSATLNDSATVTGASPTGNVEFRLYASLTDCQGDTNRLFTETVALPAGGDNTKTVSTTTGYTTPNNTTGTFYWWVGYAGDGLNEPSTSDCGVEYTTITAPTVTNVPTAP